jgi:hypothetical protein
MRNILLAIAVAMLPAAAAEPSSTQKVDKLQDSGRLLPLKRTGAGNPCAVYCPGFVKLAGTDTCVKIGGAAGIGTGISSASR